MTSARAIIERLELAPHPEGGWFRETWRSDVRMDGTATGRAVATAIHFLLEAGQRSAWHRVDADEIWLFHAGDALCMKLGDRPGDEAECHQLGSDVLGGECPQLRIAANRWQAAAPVPNGAHGWTLVSCIVSPGFEFSGFELAG